MSYKEAHAGAFMTFRHDVGACGCEFQTKIATLKEHPNRVACPGCHGKDSPQTTALLKELGEVAARFFDIQSQLATDHHLVILGGLEIKIAVGTTPR